MLKKLTEVISGCYGLLMSRVLKPIVTTDTPAAYEGQAWCDLPGIPTVIQDVVIRVDLSQVPSRENGLGEVFSSAAARPIYGHIRDPVRLN